MHNNISHFGFFIIYSQRFSNKHIYIKKTMIYSIYNRPILTTKDQSPKTIIEYIWQFILHNCMILLIQSFEQKSYLNYN